MPHVPPRSGMCASLTGSRDDDLGRGGSENVRELISKPVQALEKPPLYHSKVGGTHPPLVRDGGAGQAPLGRRR